MKKAFSSLLTALGVLPLFCACRPSYNYDAHISESRPDVFIAETESFLITLSCYEREYPYAADGIACPTTKCCEISLESTEHSPDGYAVYVMGETGWGGETSFRNTRGDYFYSQGVDAFPSGSVTLKICSGEKEVEVLATSVRTEHTISPHDALTVAVVTEKELIERMTHDKRFYGEFHVRLLRRSANYYYVGIIGTDGKTVALLLDAETGKVLARREN